MLLVRKKKTIKIRDMGISKKKLNMLAMTSLMYAATMDDMYMEVDEVRTKKERAKKEIIPPRPKGVKEFYYGEVLILAINQKNADKKARKLGLTT